MACYIPRWYTRPKTVTHPCTNRARRALTSFIRRTPLTTTPRRQPVWCDAACMYACMQGVAASERYGGASRDRGQFDPVLRGAWSQSTRPIFARLRSRSRRVQGQLEQHRPCTVSYLLRCRYSFGRGSVLPWRRCDTLSTSCYLLEGTHKESSKDQPLRTRGNVR